MQTMPRREKPRILGPAPVACIMAELSRIALMIMLKAILLLERSMSLINFIHPDMSHLDAYVVFEHFLDYLFHLFWEKEGKIAHLHDVFSGFFI